MSMIKQIRRSTEYSRARNERVYEFLSHMFALAGSFLPPILQEHLNAHNAEKQAIRQRYFSMNRQDVNTASDIWRAKAVDCLMAEVRFNQKLLQLMRQYRIYLLECNLHGLLTPDCPTSWIYQDFPFLRSRTKLRTQPATVLCEFVLAKYDLKKDGKTARLILTVEQESKSFRHQSIQSNKKYLGKSEPSRHVNVLAKAAIGQETARQCSTVLRDSPISHVQNVPDDFSKNSPPHSLPQSSRQDTSETRVLKSPPVSLDALVQCIVDKNCPSTSTDQPINISPSASEEQLFKEHCAYRLQDEFYEHQSTGEQYPENKNCSEEPVRVIGDEVSTNQAVLGQSSTDIISPSASEEQLFKEHCAYRLQDEFYEHQSTGEQCTENRKCSEEPVRVIGDEVHGNQAVLGQSPVNTVSPSASEEQLFKEHYDKRLSDTFDENKLTREQNRENRDCLEEPVIIIICNEVPDHENDVKSDLAIQGEEPGINNNPIKQHATNTENQNVCGLGHFYGSSPVIREGRAETSAACQNVAMTPPIRQQSYENKNSVEDEFVVESSEQSSVRTHESQSYLVIMSDESNTNISYHQEPACKAKKERQCEVLSLRNTSVDLPEEAVADFRAEVDTGYMRDSNGYAWANTSDESYTYIPASPGYYSVSPDEHAFHSCNTPKTRQSSICPDHQNIMSHCEDTIQGNETFMKYTGGNCVFGFRDAMKRKADNDEDVPSASSNKRNKSERKKPKKVAVRQIVTYDTATRDYSDLSDSTRVPAFRDPEIDTRVGITPTATCTYKESQVNVNIDVGMGTELIDDDDADDEVEGLCMSGGPPIYREIDGDRYQYRVPQSLIVPEWHQVQARPHRMGPCKAVDVPTYIDNISGHCLKYPEPAEFTMEPSQLAVRVPCRRPSVEQVFQPI